MAEELAEVFEKIKYIKDYLTKLGPSRRTTRIKKEKDIEVEKIKKQFDIILENVKIFLETKKVDKLEVESIEKLCSKISDYYLKIKELCCESDVEKDFFSEGTAVQENTKMEKFQLKTAISLLPAMDNTESVTKQLISNIEMYSDMMEVEERKKLINFILKSRLSESAKLRLHETYNSVSDLVKDMRDRLLSKKSDTALQQQLQRARQDSKTVEEFGKYVEELFVDLTISQADGDSKKYEILKTVNEKNAIKRFSDGLRNSRISTIIAARNYSSLKEAIRGALDEEISSLAGSEGAVMYFNRGRGRFNNFNSRNYYQGRRGSPRGQYRGQQTYYQSENFRGTNYRAQDNNVRYRGRYTRNFYNNSNRGQNSGHQFNLAEQNSNDDNQGQNSNYQVNLTEENSNNNNRDNSEIQNHFFRS